MLQETGVQGAKRATWRDNDPRPLVAKILGSNLDSNKAFETFFDEIREDVGLLRAVAQYYWDNAYVAHIRSAVTPEKRTQKRVAERTAIETTKTKFQQRIVKEATIVLLEIVTPNGKKLADCTGSECNRFGGWFVALSTSAGTAESR